MKKKIEMSYGEYQELIERNEYLEERCEELAKPVKEQELKLYKEAVTTREVRNLNKKIDSLKHQVEDLESWADKLYSDREKAFDKIRAVRNKAWWQSAKKIIKNEF